MSGTEEDAKVDGAEKRERSDDENGDADDLTRKSLFMALNDGSYWLPLTNLQHNCLHAFFLCCVSRYPRTARKSSED
jgi:hypothetical protein